MNEHFQVSRSYRAVVLEIHKLDDDLSAEIDKIDYEDGTQLYRVMIGALGEGGQEVRNGFGKHYASLDEARRAIPVLHEHVLTHTFVHEADGMTILVSSIITGKVDSSEK